MSFEYPWLLLLFVPYIGVLVWGWYMKSPSILVPWLRPFRMASGNGGGRNWRKAIPFFCFAAAGCAIITALARPREGLEEIHAKAEGIDIMIAVDLSGSMNAIDAPENATNSQIAALLRKNQLANRLETSKAEIARFIEERPNDRIGLVAFAELPYVVCPPTLDHGFLLSNLARLEPGMIGDGTGIASPIASAVQRLKDSDAKSRIVVLFTDGANTVNGQITPRDAGKLADTFDITLYTVGIGSQYSRYPQEDFFGGITFVSYPGQFDEPLLRDLASMTGGRYYKAADAAGMAAAMDEINQLEKTSMEQPIVINWRELYPYLCQAAIWLILAGVICKQTVCLRLP